MPRFNRILILVLVAGCFPFLLGAQSVPEISVEPLRISKEVAVDALDADFEEISTILVTNQSDRALQLVFDKQYEGQPKAWDVLVCQRVDNGAPFRADAESLATEDTRPVRLGPGESTEYFLVLHPNGAVGKGRTIIHFGDLNRPGQPLASSVIDFSVGRRLASGADNARGRPKALRVYPNPAIDNFFVETPANVELGKVEVYNTLGRKLKSFNRPPGREGYLIDDLPEGIYLVNIFDSSGKKIRSLRLFHRRFGA